MAINWNQPGQRFSFGNLDAAQQTLYEDNPEIAYQKLIEWYGQGNPNFATTTLGRFINAQRDRLQNSYLTAASQQAADWASQKQAFDAAEAARYNAWARQYGTPLGGSGGATPPPPPGGGTGGFVGKAGVGGVSLGGSSQPIPPYVAQTWKAPGEQLTWAKYLESNPAGLGDLANQFNELTANQRGATPGAFTVKRNLW